jgi:hypothetical protein
MEAVVTFVVLQNLNIKNLPITEQVSSFLSKK